MLKFSKNFWTEFKKNNNRRHTAMGTSTMQQYASRLDVH